MKPIVLVSSSPRRRELLERAGLEFTVDEADIEENQIDDADPAELAKSISMAKALAAAPRHPGSILIAADTLGWLDGQILGKPRNKEDARRMLEAMSGRCHRVITGFTIIDTNTGRAVSKTVETAVHFKTISKGDIDKYIATGEPLDKAGGYAIQGAGGMFVDRIEGDYYNVVGLPVNALAKALKTYNIETPGLSQFDNAADSPAR